MGNELTYTHRILNHPQWQEKRQRIFARDNYTCSLCGKQKENLVLHHIAYEKGLRPWEYKDDYYQTLCAGCHAEIHNKILPRSGWVLVDEWDAGNYGDEICELCGHDLKYVFLLHHPEWGFINVGCGCADNLTQSTEFTERFKEQQKLNKFLEKFKPIEFEEGDEYEGIFYKRILIYFTEEERVIIYLDIHGKLVVKKRSYNNISDEKVNLYKSIQNGIVNNFIYDKTYIWETDKQVREDISRILGVWNFPKDCVITK